MTVTIFEDEFHRHKSSYSDAFIEKVLTSPVTLVCLWLSVNFFINTFYDAKMN